MEKTTKKAALDRAELQSQLNELTGRSTGDARRAKEVQTWVGGCVVCSWRSMRVCGRYLQCSPCHRGGLVCALACGGVVPSAAAA